MKVSIALATFNGERYILDQLRSFARQTRTPDELVVSDDASTDHTVEIIREFSGTCPFPVRIIQNNTNIGCAQNFSRALELCEGNIIFLSDQDDVWFEEKISIISSIFESNMDTLFTVNDAVITDKNLLSSGTTKMLQTLRSGAKYNSVITGCCTAIRDTIRDLACPIPIGLMHDDWIHAVARSLQDPMIIREPMQYFRRHDDNLSSNITSRACRLTVLDRIARLPSSNTSSRMRHEIRYLSALIDRFEERLPTLTNRMVRGRVMASSEKLQRYRDACSQREDILASGLPHRIARSFAFLWQGGYNEHFSGWRSFVRDILVGHSKP